MSDERKELNDNELNDVAGGKGYEKDSEVVINGNNEIVSQKRICKPCNKEFKTETEYKEHMKKVHNQ